MKRDQPEAQTLREIWSLRRQQCNDEAWSLVDQSIPFVLGCESSELEKQRQLLDEFVVQGIKRIGLASVIARLDQQYRLHGLPDGSQALDSLHKQCRTSAEFPTSLSALVQQTVIAGENTPALLLQELAEFLAMQGERNEAEGLLRRVLHHHDAETECLSRAHSMMALLAYRKGDRPECFHHLGEAAALGSHDPITLQFLCKLQIANGSFDAAAATLSTLKEVGLTGLSTREERLRYGLKLAAGLADEGLLTMVCAGLAGGIFEDGAELLALIPGLIDGQSQQRQLLEALLRKQQRDEYSIQRNGASKRQSCTRRQAEQRRVRRLGLLAPSFAANSDAALVWTLKPFLEAEGFELYGFESLKRGIKDDLSGEQEEKGRKFCSLAGLETEAAVDCIRSQDLDAIIDLCGWQDGQRQDALIQRVAPLQLGWFNHEISSGGLGLDYLLLDRFQVPTDRDSLLEGLLVLPGSFLALASPQPPIALSAEVHGDLVVTAPAHHVQIRTVEVWAAILHENRGRRLVCLDQSYQQKLVWQPLEAAFASFGIKASRLKRADRSMQEIKAALVLDPFPWCDWRSALASLQQGVPVVTLRGAGLHQRRTAGLLDLLGLGSFAASDPDTYVAIATTLLADRGLQAELQRQIPEQIQASLLMQPAQFAADLKLALDSI